MQEYVEQLPIKDVPDLPCDEKKRINYGSDEGDRRIICIKDKTGNHSAGSPGHY